MRYFIHLGFDGTRYSGWQKQANTATTVQGELERILARVFKKEIPVYGCGRTDAGVHASQYVAHIDLDGPPSFDLRSRLNRNLPDDIAIFEVFEVPGDVHCRYDAVSRTYDYFIHWKKDPVLIRYSNFFEEQAFDLDRMKEAAALILRTTDCKPLCKHPDLYENTHCRISACKLVVNEAQGRLRFTITSDRFLRGMVRFCIFFLVKVGSGEMPLDQLEAILGQDLVLPQKQPALPHGLFLSKVTYPDITLAESHHLMRMLKNGLEE